MGCCVMLFSPAVSKAQNAPVTTIGTVGNAMPGQVAVPITVTGFNNIGAVSLAFDYPYSGLHFLQGTPNPLLGGFIIGDQDQGNGKHRVTMGWYGSGISLPNGSVIMTVYFTYINGIDLLEFYDNGGSCEYADANYNVLNDVPQSTFYINGTVCGNIENPGPIAGSTSLCKGQTGVGYSISPVANATNYNWTMPPGATIMSGNNTNAVSVDFSPLAVSGNITVNGMNVCGSGPSSQLPVSLNILPIANAGADMTIPYGTSTTLNAASGGSGSYIYHWSPEPLLVNPNIQNTQTINLTLSTVFTLLVTNQASLCRDSDEVVVAISGGPLNTNPVSIPNSMCRGTMAQLIANAGGGSGNYTYSWSCIPPGNPPWTSDQANPVVSPDSSKVYQLSVADGFNTVQGSASLAVSQLPSATLSGGDTLCGEGNSTILTVALTGTPPWSFYYSNGTTTWLVTGQNTTPFSIVANEPGIYIVLAMSDAQCTGTTSGSAVVAVFPVPPSPVISINGTELSSTGCCGNQWYLDGVPIPGATGQIYEPRTTAHYCDIVTVNGCPSDTSNTIYYLVDGINEADRPSFLIEPNPAENFITVKLKSGMNYMGDIIIYSISGKKQASYLLNPLNDEKEILINIGHLAPGLYFLSIGTKSKKTVMKLIVQ